MQPESSPMHNLSAVTEPKRKNNDFADELSHDFRKLVAFDGQTGNCLAGKSFQVVDRRNANGFTGSLFQATQLGQDTRMLPFKP